MDAQLIDARIESFLANLLAFKCEIRDAIASLGLPFRHRVFF
jgi:hypothetical protein